MKCVQIVGQGLPVRMSDEDARTIVVVDHDGEYCPKRVWKQFHDHNLDPRFQTRVASYIDSRGRITRHE